MMTAQQSRLLDVLSGQKDGVCPSYEDLKTLMGLKSKSGIHRMLVGLEERGFIRRIPNRARAIEVIRRPVSEPVAPSDTVRVADVKDPDAYGDAMRALAAMARRNGIALTFSAVTSPIE